MPSCAPPRLALQACFCARSCLGAPAAPPLLPACSGGQVLPMRPWQVVPGTAFVVDRFCNLPACSPHRHWFLTHFHADHYKGLTGRQAGLARAAAPRCADVPRHPAGLCRGSCGELLGSSTRPAARPQV
jgi:hypothetical protein